MKSARAYPCHRMLRAFATAILVLAGAATARGQSYGDGDQVLTVTQAAFRSVFTQNQGEWLIDADGYGYPATGEFPGQTDAFAPFELPEGALLERVCLYANDAAVGTSLAVTLERVKMVYGGEGPAVEAIDGASASSSGGGGYQAYCSDPLADTIRSSAEIGGSIQPVRYRVHAKFLTQPGQASGLGAVRLTWKRQLPPAPATPTFGDVPASDFGFAYIEALAASGITSGCGAGLFCPDAKLTRRQMAVFLAKALGLHWPN